LEQNSANNVSNLYESDHENDNEDGNDDNIEVYDDDDNNEDENHSEDEALRVSSAPNIPDNEIMNSGEECDNREYERKSDDGKHLILSLYKDSHQVDWLQLLENEYILEDERLKDRTAFKAKILYSQADINLSGLYKGLDPNASTNFQTRIKKVWLHYFLVFFPMATIPKIVSSTNANLTAKEAKLDHLQFLVLIGLFLAMSLQKRHASYRDFWADHKQGPDHICDGPNFGKYMPLRRFEHFMSCLQLVSYNDDDLRKNRWCPIDDFIREFNLRTKSVLRPSDFVTVDESMVKWLGAGGWSNKGMPHVTKIPRKPTPVGCEIKNMACAETRIIFHLMLQKGAQENREALGEHFKQTKSVGTSQVLLAAQESNLFDTKRCVVADSAFGSVKSALNCARNGLHCQMLVKTAHTFTPKAAIARKNLQPGESVCYVTEIEGHKLICLGWQDQTTKIFIATCGT
jgi:hypothetical protein